MGNSTAFLLIKKQCKWADSVIQEDCYPPKTLHSLSKIPVGANRPQCWESLVVISSHEQRAASSSQAQGPGILLHIHADSIRAPLSKGSMKMVSRLLSPSWSLGYIHLCPDLSSHANLAPMQAPYVRVLNGVNNHSLLPLWYSVILRPEPGSLLCLTNFGWHISSFPSGPSSPPAKAWDAEEAFSSPPKGREDPSTLTTGSYKAFFLNFFTFSPWTLSWLSAVPRAREADFVHLPGELPTGRAAPHLGIRSI